jgi:hypothetical protein
VQRRPARNILFLILALLGFLAWSTAARTFQRQGRPVSLAGGAGEEPAARAADRAAAGAAPTSENAAVTSPGAHGAPAGGHGYDPAFCRHDADASNLEAAGDSVFRLETEVLFDTGAEEPARMTVEGTGTVLFGRYVLTVAHAVTQERLETSIRSPRGGRRVAVDGRRLSIRTWLLHGHERLLLRPLAADETEDVALLGLPEGETRPAFPYAVGDSSHLELGDFVALIERDPVAGTLYRPGAVAALRGPAVIAPIARTEGAFLVSFGLTTGESGAPIVATRRGRYELVGLAQGTYQGPRQLAWAVRMSRALAALQRHGGSEVREFLALCDGSTG